MTRPVYDWRALARWGIPESRLPERSEVRFRPPSLWEQHKLVILSTVGIVLLQAALIAGLLVQRARARRAESKSAALAGHLLTAHEDERRRLARELHDDMTQRLARLAIDAARIERGASVAPAEGIARSLREELVRLSEDVHALSYRLHPSVLDELGLAAALQAECDRLSRQASIAVEVDVRDLPQPLPREPALCLFRVAQEALRNIARHAQAHAAVVSLAAFDGGLQLAVRDDGRGFDAARSNERPSLGQMSMRERVRLLGGKLDIESAPGHGTTVVAWVPLRSAAT
ncbi:MAG: sensor histidine kinase [Betaproteobacteria bacterium]|nr:sensor histidine kinase [Betaproteobacteria bacterium]